jgi:hypothetical protein
VLGSFHATDCQPADCRASRRDPAIPVPNYGIRANLLPSHTAAGIPVQDDEAIGGHAPRVGSAGFLFPD